MRNSQLMCCTVKRYFRNRAWNTQQSIADGMGCGVATVNEILNKFGKRQMSESEKTFKPLLYNIWNLDKQDNAVKNTISWMIRKGERRKIIRHATRLIPQPSKKPKMKPGKTVDANELYIAREKLSQDPEDRARTATGTFVPVGKTWSDYCKDIGSSRISGKKLPLPTWSLGSIKHSPMYRRIGLGLAGKCGEWLKENVKQGGTNQYNEEENRNMRTSLKKLKITPSESSRLQKIADIPAEV